VNFVKLLFGSNGAADVVTTVSGYLASILVAAITSSVPSVTGDTTVNQLAGYGVAAAIAVLARFTNSTIGAKN
jgi:hypothetical protein